MNVLNDFAEVRAVKKAPSEVRQDRTVDGDQHAVPSFSGFRYRRRHRIHHLTCRRTIKEESVVTNYKRVYHQTCSALSGNAVITPFETFSDCFHKQSIKVVMTENLTKLVNHVTVKVGL